MSGLIFVLVTASSNKVRNTLKRLGMGNGSPTNSLKSQKRLKNYYTQQQQNSVPQVENYINRHVSINTSSTGENRDSDDEKMGGRRASGFLWQWNHMIQNKKWKSYVITNGNDEELFQLRMLRDFREFCSNSDGRLLKFWDESWHEKEKLSILNSTQL